MSTDEMSAPNPSTAQARVIVDELRRHGVEHAVISPGSRSAALAIAFDQDPGFTTRVALDERSAGYQALGRCLATGVPVVAVCTSGTAVANHLPAVVEADLSMVPLIVISADRPPEALNVAANQTIEQPGIFGNRVRWTCSLPPADSSRDDNGFWRTSVSQAVARAMGHGGRPGPVHLNISFREPTVPVSDDGRSRAEPFAFSTQGRPDGAPWQRHGRPRPAGHLLTGLDGARGLVVAGRGDYDPIGLRDAVHRLGWPLLATAMSALVGTEVVASYHHLLVDGVPAALRPDVVITVGSIGPSDRLGALTGLDGEQINIDPWGAWNDPRRHATLMIQADPVATLSAIPVGAGDELRSAWLRADSHMRAALDGRLALDPVPSGPAVARALAEVDYERLVVASSMPIRDVDAYAPRRSRVISNRGASGIDGFVSTAIGVALTGRRTVAMSGDLSLLHDVTGLVGSVDADLALVVIDNGGGGLFDLLPQSRHAPGFERLFVTPHGLDLAAVTRSFGASSEVVEDPGALGARLSTRLDAGGLGVLVVPVDREEELKLRHSLDEVAREVCAELS